VAVPPAPDLASGVTSEDDTTHGSTSGGARRLIAAVLVVVILAAAATFAWLLVQRSDDASGLQSDREKVMAQARAFVLRVNTYGPDLLQSDGTMPEYRRLVGEVITPKFAESFDQSVPAAEATVAQAAYGRSAEVFGAGVSVIDSDSATALVAGSFTSSYPDTENPDERINDVPLPFRVRVQLVKIDGNWLVDAFVPVVGEGEDPTAVPSGSPSATPEPTEEASP
jgi:Mce-associated membrane protein